MLPTIGSVLFFLYKLISSDVIIHNSGYTYLRYAYNILAGNGYAYNSDGVYILGTAGVVNTFIISLLKLIFSSTIGAYLLVFISALFAGAALLGLYLFLFNAVDLRKTELAIFAAFSLSWIIICTPFVDFILSGEDTFLSITFIIISISFLYKLKKKFSPYNIVGFLISFWLCYNVRIENLIIIGIFSLLFLSIEKFDLNSKKVIISSLIIIILTDFVLKHILFNTFIPLPFFAKRVGFLGFIPTGRQSSIHNLILFLFYASPFIIIIIFTAAKSILFKAINYITPVLAMVLLLLFADHSEAMNARYFYPLIILLAIFSFYSLNNFTNTFVATKDVLFLFLKNRWLAIGMFVFSILLMHFAGEYYYDNHFTKPEQTNKQHISLWKTYPKISEDEKAAIMLDILKVLPAKSKIAVLFAGFNLPGKQLNLIDLSGCNNTEIARNGFSFETISKISPDIIFLPDSNFSSLNELLTHNNEFNKTFIYLPNVLKSGIAINRNNYKAAKDILVILRKHYSTKP